MGPWPTLDRNASIQREGSDLVDDAGTLACQLLASEAAAASPVDLICCLSADELHGWAGRHRRLPQRRGNRSSAPCDTV